MYFFSFLFLDLNKQNKNYPYKSRACFHSNAGTCICQELSFIVSLELPFSFLFPFLFFSFFLLTKTPTRMD